MKLTDLFQKNPNIIINTDIDGILCGVILCNYCNCKVAGFSNSYETVWLQDGIASVYDPVYIDMFVPRDNVFCIDQHIVSVNKAHHDKYISTGTKISPQLDRQRIYISQDYKNKYPFGAVHYIIAMLEKEGVRVSLPNLDNIVDTVYQIRMGDLLLRADDAMKTTLDSYYMNNAKDWWNWLIKESNNAQSVQDMNNFLYNKTPRISVRTIKQNTTSFLKTRYASPSSDGGFKVITDKTDSLLPNIKNYINDICKFMGMPMSYPLHLNPHYGTYRLKNWNPKWENELIKYGTIEGEDVFSYAFIFGPNRDNNFSYTVNMK